MDKVKGAAVCDNDALQRMGVKRCDVAKLVSISLLTLPITFGDMSLPTLSISKGSLRQ